MDFARITARLEAPAKGGVVDMVLDTDTYNEIDDQFALAYALVAEDAMRCQAVYAAPFHNDRSDGPGDGMRRSREEIDRVCERLGRKPLDGIYNGSERWMANAEDSVPSEARDDLIARAMARDPQGPPLYVVAIGAPTNVSSALVAEPAIAERIVVVWLGSNPPSWNSAREFNCLQNHAASALLFDCGVPLVQVPCTNVAARLTTTHAEIHEALAGQGAIGDYLVEIYDDYVPRRIGHSKVIWDISAVAWLIDPGWLPSCLTSSPILNENMTFSRNFNRHPMREVVAMHRDGIFGDLFQRIRALA